MRLTAAQRQVRYRKRHPERVAAAAEKVREKRKPYFAAYRIKMGPHPMNTPGSEAYKKYRATEKYRVTAVTGHLRRHYGITYEQYQFLLDKQKGLCAICGGDGPNRKYKTGLTVFMKLFVDHDHKTGRIRGLLCSTCNTGISSLKDDIDVLKSAIFYLNRSMKEATVP